MLSGTPLTNKLEDLQGEMSLLRVWPFTLGKGSDAGWMNHFWEVRGLVREPVALSLVRAAAGRPPDDRSLARSRVTRSRRNRPIPISCPRAVRSMRLVVLAPF